MKPGDLVRVINGEYGETHFLYGGDDIPFDKYTSMIPTDISFGTNQVGTVISNEISDPVYRNDYVSYVKIISPNGIGWILTGYLEVISETRRSGKNQLGKSPR